MLDEGYLEVGSTAHGYSKCRKITTIRVKSTTTFNKAIFAESLNFSAK
jgi:hypothetical protein